MHLSTELEIYYHLGVALAIGLLMGVERGWKEREAGVAERIAGVRTCGLIGLPATTTRFILGNVPAPGDEYPGDRGCAHRE